MSGWLGDSSQARTEPALGDLKVQTSSYGLVIPVGYGRFRMAGNLLWYGDFKSITREEYGEGGKGGGSPVRTTYAYRASVMMGLGEGPYTQIRTIWVGKEKFTAVAATSRRREGVHDTEVINGAPIAVTFSSTFVEHVSAVIATEDILEGHDVGLVEGTDFTRSGGVYTFSGAWFLDEFGAPRNRKIRIRYTYDSNTDAMSALASIGLTLRNGTANQPIWPYLTENHPTQAIAYSGIAYVFGRDYNLDSSAAVPNHNFEVDGPLQYSATIPDANPAEVIKDILVNPTYGCSFPSNLIESFAAYSAYCVASGLFVSPVYTAQRSARDAINELLEATNSVAGWTGDRLRIIPRGDKTVVGNGVTYTASNLIVQDLGIDDFVGDANNPVQIERIDPTEAYNRVTVEYSNRASDYRAEPVIVSDEASIASYGNRPESSLSWKFFCDGAAANQAAQLRLQRYQAARGTYKFKLTARCVQVEIGDLVRVAEPKAYLFGMIMMIMSISEGSDDNRSIVAEEFPIGTANAPLVAPQLGSGFKPQYNAPSGDAVAPVVLEMPTAAGLELRIATAGQLNNTYWGGAEVYASLDDGASYKMVSRVSQHARYGALVADLSTGKGGTIEVQLAGRGGQLMSTSDAEAESLATLCFVGTPESGEWLTYETATLVSLNRYRLTGLHRGRFGTVDQAALTGAQFVFIDGGLAVVDDVPRGMIGKTIKIKLASYNLFGAALQSLAVAPEFTYKITGRFVGAAAAPIGINLLPYSTFALSASGISVDRNEGTFLPVLRKPTLSSESIGGSPSNSPGNAILEYETPGGAGANPYAIWPKVTVEAGASVVAMAKVLPINTEGWAGIYFYDAAGGVTGGEFPPKSNWVPDKAGTQQSDFRVASNYENIGVITVAPANTVAYRLLVGISGTQRGASSSRMSIFEPLLGPLRPEQRTFPTWSPGVLNTSGTQQLEIDATSTMYTPLSAIADIVLTPSVGTKTIEAMRFTPDTSGELEITLSGEAYSKSETAQYILALGTELTGVSAKQRSQVADQHVAPVNGNSTGDFVPSHVSRSPMVNVTAGTEVVISITVTRRARVITKQVPPPPAPTGNDSFVGITLRARLRKR